MTPGAISALSLEELIVGIALLLLVSIIASKASARIGVPALILFLTVGMLAGSDGVGGIAFDNARIAQWLGVVALSFILFSGGLETNWTFVRRSVWRAASLATVGVAITTGIIAWFAAVVLGFTPAEGFLLGAIVSSTDAAAVFSVLRGRGVRLDEDVVSTLELESGSNDPMAVFLTTAGVQMLMSADLPISEFALHFVREMTFGAVAGLAAGFAAVALLNALRLEADGLYPVLTVAVVLFTYGATVLIGGNGFLAVYLAGIVMGNRNFIQRRSLTRFHDGLAWLMQIAMFLTLGLLVFPSQLPPLAGVSLALAAVLTFIARPIAVFVALAASHLNVREKTVIAWTGLRGAVPIILATFPLLAGVPKSGLIFNIVFFVVVASVAVQGTTMPLVARWLRLDAATIPDPSPSDVTLPTRAESSLVTLEVSPLSAAAGHRLVELRDWPREALILVLYRGNEFFVPNGATMLTPGDRLIVLTSRTTLDAIRGITEGAAGGMLPS
ncbi:MAG: potassium/hydrogen antiporter [Acidobacteriota bacterium]|jgi:cell volume regulation protein A|nr:potassium/hydrogen antiporter [Acidobacteriota bacterium]